MAEIRKYIRCVFDVCCSFIEESLDSAGIHELTIKFANYPPSSLFIMNLYQLDRVNQVYYLEVVKRLREKVRR